MKKLSIIIMLQLPVILFSQQITNITPNQGSQGQSVQLIISGNNISFSGFSCWSNTNNLSDFRFSQWSGTNMLYGFPTTATSTQLNGVVNIPPFQPTGLYNLEVFNCFTANWVSYPNSFQINSSGGVASWNCINNTCIDPGNGSGQYMSLQDCQNACVVPVTWDCISGVAGFTCVDPGTGLGSYTSLTACQAVCGIATPTWDCINGTCVDPGTGLGSYTSLTTCQVVCGIATPTWDCINGTCIDPGTGNGTYASLTACQSNCVVVTPTWDCINGTCIDPGTGSGTYASLSACQAFCSTASWNCGVGGCYAVPAGMGVYTSLFDCQAVCGVITPSWDCDGQGNCYDPGNGLGQYASSAICQAVCLLPTPSWDCINGACIDPGNGNGVYATQPLCVLSCVSTLTFVEDIEKLSIYPNPTKDIISIQFDNLIVQDIKLRIVNNLGSLVFFDNIVDHIGKYSKQINLQNNSKGIYFLEIETKDGMINKKLILQ